MAAVKKVGERFVVVADSGKSFGNFRSQDTAQKCCDNMDHMTHAPHGGTPTKKGKGNG